MTASNNGVDRVMKAIAELRATLDEKAKRDICERVDDRPKRRCEDCDKIMHLRTPRIRCKSCFALICPQCFKEKHAPFSKAIEDNHAEVQEEASRY